MGMRGWRAAAGIILGGGFAFFERGGWRGAQLFRVVVSLAAVRARGAAAGLELLCLLRCSWAGALNDCRLASPR